jgi:transcriptional regulator with XRE-family HTH domain
MQMMRSLEDYRREQLLTIRAFAAALGISPQTYRRLLREPNRVQMRIKRRVFTKLGVASPYLVTELVPSPSPILVQQVLDAIEAGDRDGWISVDPETLEPLDKRCDGEGNLL